MNFESNGGYGKCKRFVITCKSVLKGRRDEEDPCFIKGIELLVVKEPTGLCMSEYRLTIDEELKIAGVPRDDIPGLRMESSTVLLILKRS
ncbi:hypothetical protein Bca4012_059327 [Brassica carinata]